MAFVRIGGQTVAALLHLDLGSLPLLAAAKG